MDKILSQVKDLLNTFGVNQAPVDVMSFIKQKDIDLSYEQLDDDWSGFCVRSPGGSKVVLNEKHHIHRQRFTAAHELGHLILHCGHDDEEQVFVDKTVAYNRNDASSSGEVKKEIEANRFAAELLMPKKFIEKDIEGKESLRYEDVEELAKKYEVSERAMTIRIEKLTGITFFI
jgi:Zn-dependent peptidase ImmA (M78 family)